MAMLRRYQGASTFQARGGNVFSARYVRLDKTATPFFTVKTTAPSTLDLLSVKYYSTPLLYWLIQDMNDIVDPLLTIPAGAEIKIPQV